MDPSLTFRREGICAMNIDECNGLACLTKIEEGAKETTIPPGKEILQSKKDSHSAKLDEMYECILCACCRTSCPSTGTGAGVCIMSKAWKDEQDSSLISFISAFLSSNSFRLNFVSISPDLIFNCGGVSIAFVFVTKWGDCCNAGSIFNRVKTLKTQFARLYVVATLSTKEQNDSFMRSYFQYEMEFGKPAFVPVTDAEMGFEKIVKIAHSRGVCKQQKVASKLKVERKRTVQDTDMFIRVLTSIPNIDKHDANTLYLTIGSIETTAKTSKEDLLANTDLSSDKSEMLTRFFQDPEFYLSPKFN